MDEWYGLYNLDINIWVLDAISLLVGIYYA